MRGHGRAARLGALVLGVGLAALLSGCGASTGQPDERPAPTPSGGGELSIGHARGSNGIVRATATITIAGSDPLTVLFDTGSSGLRVFDSVLPASGVDDDGETFTTQFANGTVVSGVVARAPMVLGGYDSAGPVAFKTIRETTCADEAPGCPGDDGVEGFARSIGADGILGVGLAADEVYSPLLQLAIGVPGSYTIHWSGEGGRVTFDTPPAQPLATLAMKPVPGAELREGVPSWDDHHVPVCWQIGDAERGCVGTVFDTGATSLQFPIGFPGGPTEDVRKLANGQSITAAESIDAEPFYSFETGRHLADDFVTVQPGSRIVNTGLQIFEDFAVTFDLVAGTVLLAAP